MKKILVLMMISTVISLTACGENTSSKNPIEETLISTEWKAVINSRETSMDFSEDGTGTIMYGDDNGKDMSWEIADELIVKVEYESGNGKYYYNLEYSENEDSVRLTDQSECMILVPSENYDTETAAVKQERLANAKELDWSTAHDVYVDNAARFEEEYAGHIWKWTAQVYRISETGYCQMANERSNGFPLNSISVYMDSSELMNVNTGATITVIGFLENSSQMTNAFEVR